MRGPVGLFAAPEQSAELVDLAVEHEGIELTVHLDSRFLHPPYLKRQRLLFALEGHGRFWLHVAGEGESRAGASAQQGE